MLILAHSLPLSLDGLPRILLRKPSCPSPWALSWLKLAWLRARCGGGYRHGWHQAGRCNSCTSIEDGASISRKGGPKRNSWISRWTRPAPGMKWPHEILQVGNWAGSSSSEKDLGLLVDIKLCQCCTLAAGIAAASWAAPVRMQPAALCLALVRPLLPSAPTFGHICYKEEITKMDRVQWRATRIVRKLKQQLGRAEEVWLAVRRLRGMLLLSPATSWDGVVIEMTNANPNQRCRMKGQEATVMGCNKGNTNWTSAYFSRRVQLGNLLCFEASPALRRR